MANEALAPSHLSDDDLLAEVKRLASVERQATAQLIASLAALDARRLYLREGCSSLFIYCTQVLRLSEHAAYGRIEAARVARRLPVVLELLIESTITLTTVTLLGPHLTTENHRTLLDAARNKSRREVEELIARLHPRADVPSAVRKLPTPTQPAQPALQSSDAEEPHASGATPSVSQRAVSRPAVMAPLAPARYKVQFTASADTYAKLRRAQDLLRHQIPNGDPAAIVDKALTLLLADLENGKLGAAGGPRTGTNNGAAARYIPRRVRRAVWARDGGQCAFVGREGRCTERGFLEFHHIDPYARGGKPTVENLSLRCRNHNQYEAEQQFGRRRSPRRGESPEPEQPLLVRENRSVYFVPRSCSPIIDAAQLGSNRVAPPGHSATTDQPS